MALWILICLILAGFIAVFIEFFVPAGGLIGIGGIVCVIAGIVLTFTSHGTVPGTVMLVAVLISAPLFFMLCFRIFPYTFFGKRLILRDRQETVTGFTSYSPEEYDGLVDQEGVAATNLRPSGIMKIGNAKYSVVTSGEYIDAGQRIRVINVEGSRIVVRLAGKFPVKKEQESGQ